MKKNLCPGFCTFGWRRHPLRSGMVLWFCLVALCLLPLMGCDGSSGEEDPCGFEIDSLSEGTLNPTSTLAIYGRFGDTQGERKVIAGMAYMTPGDDEDPTVPVTGVSYEIGLDVVHWSDSVVIVKKNPYFQVYGGLYEVDVTCPGKVGYQPRTDPEYVLVMTTEVAPCTIRLDRLEEDPDQPGTIFLYGSFGATQDGKMLRAAYRPYTASAALQIVSWSESRIVATVAGHGTVGLYLTCSDPNQGEYNTTVLKTYTIDAE